MNMPLPPQGPPGPDDELADDAGLAALYRKLPHNEPSPALDAAVLRAAAQAIAGAEITRLPQGERRKGLREAGDWVRPRPVTEPAPLKPSPAVETSRAPRHRSLVALASAASLVLVAGLAWHMREMPSRVDAPARSPAAAAKSAPQRLASQNHATSSTVGALASDSATPVAAAAPAESMASNAVVASRPLAPAVTDIPAGGAPTVSANAVVSPAMKNGMVDKTADSSTRAAHRESVSPSPTSPTPMPASVAELSAAPPMPEPAQPAQTPPPPVEEVSSVPVMQAPAPAPPAPALPSPPHIVAVAPVAGRADTSAATDVISPQARELEAIRKLFAEHHDDQAQQRLQNFHRLHPQWQLPADLQARLREP
jgi:hypothetical protein